MIGIFVLAAAVQSHACDGSKDKGKEGKPKTERTP